MTQSTKHRFFPLYALLLLKMSECSEKKEGAAVSASGSAPSSAAGAPPVAAPAAAARRNAEESQALVLPQRSPNLNAHLERWNRSVK